MTLSIGAIFDGKYEIRRVLGEGGMGVVYEAFHTKLEQPVAIKLMLPEMLQHPELVARFAREARAAAKIKSRHVARVFDVDATPEGLPYIVMEVLTGRDLASVLDARQRLPVADVVGYLLQACSAIREAHARGIVHRDLKPANVFLAKEDDQVVVKVLDFGISKELVTSGSKLTTDFGVVGTIFYMSPEQVRGENVDTRSDIWALGALLYELLSGRPPFEGNVTQVSAAIVSTEPPSLSTFRDDVPVALESAVRRALAKRPADRFPDVAAMMSALVSFAPAKLVADLENAPTTATLTPSHPIIIDPTATTLDASDRVRAPAGLGFTADGVSNDALRPRVASRRMLGAAGVLFGVVVVVAAVFTFRARTLDPVALAPDANQVAPATVASTTEVGRVASALPASSVATLPSAAPASTEPTASVSSSSPAPSGRPSPASPRRGTSPTRTSPKSDPVNVPAVAPKNSAPRRPALERIEHL